MRTADESPPMLSLGRVAADGSLGDMLFFHTYKNPGLVIDIVEDIRLMNDQAMKAAPRKTGVLILGGGGYRLAQGEPAATGILPDKCRSV